MGGRTCGSRRGGVRRGAPKQSKGPKARGEKKAARLPLSCSFRTRRGLHGVGPPPLSLLVRPFSGLRLRRVGMFSLEMSVSPLLTARAVSINLRALAQTRSQGPIKLIFNMTTEVYSMKKINYNICLVCES
jgi:hypothetical protein